MGDPFKFIAKVTVYTYSNHSNLMLHSVIRPDHRTNNTVELQWLEHLWNHKNIFEMGVVRANEC